MSILETFLLLRVVNLGDGGGDVSFFLEIGFLFEGMIWIKKTFRIRY